MTDTIGSEPAADVRVKAEPLTYERRSPTSYFRDLALRDRDRSAAGRLQRHAQEMDTLIAERDERAVRALGIAGIERRTAPNRTQGQGGYFAVPLWIIESFATAPRAGRVVAGLIPGFPLPSRVGSVSLPRVTTGTAAQAGPDGAPSPARDVVDAADSSSVVTVDGQSSWPLQALEQSPAGAHLDWAIFTELTEAYDLGLEQQLIFGVGANSTSPGNGQLLGINQVSGINSVAYTNGSPTLSGMYPSFGQAAAAIGNNRKKPPECWLATTSRWAWIATSVDTSQRPITPPDTSDPPPLPDGNSPQAIGALAGRWPVYLDDAIPTNLGAGANQDQVIAFRPSDLILLEGDPVTSTFEEVLSGTLRVRFQFRNYVAALTGRYPTGIATIGGTGFVIQSGF